jgi:hypothetical protein
MATRALDGKCQFLTDALQHTTLEHLPNLTGQPPLEV